MNIFLLTKIVNRKGKIVRTKSHRYIMPIFLNPSRANMRDGIVLNASADIPVCEHTTSILTCYSKPFFGGEKKDSIAEGTASQSNLSGEKTNTCRRNLYSKAIRP